MECLKVRVTQPGKCSKDRFEQDRSWRKKLKWVFMLLFRKQTESEADRLKDADDINDWNLLTY